VPGVTAEVMRKETTITNKHWPSRVRNFPAICMERSFAQKDTSSPQPNDKANVRTWQYDP